MSMLGFPTEEGVTKGSNMGGRNIDADELAIFDHQTGHGAIIVDAVIPLAIIKRSKKDGRKNCRDA